MDEWVARANELAQWTWTHLVNRTDVWGAYFDIASRAKTGSKSWTAPAIKRRGKVRLTPAKLEGHYAAVTPENVIGLHSTSTSNTCLWAGVDIDAHDGDNSDPAKNEAAAIKLYNFLKSIDIHCLLIDSNGKGGFHLLVSFSAPVPTKTAYHWMRQITTQCDMPCEQFPKQSSIAADGFGNWLRLPGRHHTTDHYSRVWDGETWLEGREAIDAILSAPTNAVPEVDVPEDVYETPIEEQYGAEEGLELAMQCLAAIRNDDLHYDDWLRVGTAMHHLGDGSEAALKAWIMWSAKSGKHQSDFCIRSWPSFARQSAPGTKRTGLGTLLKMAKDCGVKIVLPPVNRLTAWQINPPTDITPSVNPEVKPEAKPAEQVMAAAVDPEADPKPLKYEKKSKRQKMANVDDRFTTLKSGRETTTQIYIPLPDITENARRTMQGWPAVCGGQLFSVNHTDKPIYSARNVTWIRNHQHLFAWYSQHANLRWCGGEAENGDEMATPVTKQEFFEHLLSHSQIYDSIETLPHEPVIEGAYYMPCELPEVDMDDKFSPLKQLVEMFNPDTEVDRELLFACLLTPGWGGRSGARPAFVFTSNYGKGVGKSQTAQVIAHLWGGYIMFKADEDTAEFCARLLDSEASGRRVIIMDNMKGRKSDANLEMLLTADSINAKKMYFGTRFIPNRFTWIITANTPQLSSDLAVRSVIIRIGKQKHGGKDFHSRACALIDANRGEILSELFQYMKRPKHPPEKHCDRWADWQENILGLFPDPEKLAEAIVERRPAVDSDNTNADDVACEIRRYINSQYADSAETGVFFISMKQMSKLMIYTELSSEKYGRNGPNSWIRGMIGSSNLRSLIEKPYKNERGWIWVGEDADPTDSPKPLLDPSKEPA